MPTEEQTYREFVRATLGDIKGSISSLKESVDTVDGKVTYTNGKVRKIIIAMFLLAGIIIGQHFPDWKDIIGLFAGSASLN